MFTYVIDCGDYEGINSLKVIKVELLDILGFRLIK